MWENIMPSKIIRLVCLYCTIMDILILLFASEIIGHIFLHCR